MLINPSIRVIKAVKAFPRKNQSLSLSLFHTHTHVFSLYKILKQSIAFLGPETKLKNFEGFFLTTYLLIVS
ncbi:hypothetical protein QVD17_11139 [Tagetes erecta]|uniref:Uncharacterized protein n=1 Tax=Tagetes erecta TaxID=13708 RepID=A0AAD8P081_TARER|nr:hypothetical protein QVD17_11139 [Tagetes erecta]